MRTNSFAWPLILLLLASSGCEASAVDSKEPGEAEAQVNGAVHTARAGLTAGAVQFAEPETVTATATFTDDKSSDDERAYRTESIRGHVVWMSEALNRALGITSVPEAKERVLAIETADGDLLPIVEDLRGRSFRTDQRLREMQVELLARRYDATPMIQIVKIYEIKDGKKYIVDYWCDICAIVMFEMGPCACCQDDNRLRKRLVED